nr:MULTISPECIES: hypothetical protein [Deinococcus]
MLLRTALIAGALIGLLNIVFVALDHGLPNIPVWFYLAQLLLLPAMLLPMYYFPQAATTRNFLHRAGLFALGWAVPFAIYKLSSDALKPNFDLAAALISYVVTLALLSLLFAAIRRPAKGA